MIVYLNGEPVDATEIDSRKHKFIGMFRPPQCPRFKADWICPGCMKIERFVWEETLHYREGCFDVPQYVGITIS